MREVKITKQYPECGHSYAWPLEDLQDPEKRPDECPICRVVLVDSREDFILDD
jgi:hypothetical protein